jgi:sugar phosphate isomerase/epimerase
MKLLSEVAKPGIMISQTWPKSREVEGQTLKAIEKALEISYFKAFQTVDIPYRNERKMIAELLGNQNLPLNYFVARVLNENKLNLSDMDKKNRKKSVDHLIRCLDDAREASAGTYTLLSGPRPIDLKERSQALKYLKDSLAQLCEEAMKSPPLKIAIEPLDVNVHKKNTLGTTEEAVNICHDLKQKGLDLWLCIDTAHAMLNDEDPIESLNIALPYTAEFHFCNCVTDPSDQLYGDYHIPFGEPGILDISGISKMMAKMRDMGYLNTTDKPPIMCEVLKREQDDSIELLNYCKNIQLQAWEMIQHESN